MNSIIAVFVIFIFPALTLCTLGEKEFLKEKTELRKNVGQFLFAVYIMIMEVYVLEYLIHPGRIIDFSVQGSHASDLKFLITRTAFCLVSAICWAIVIRVIHKHQRESGKQENE